MCHARYDDLLKIVKYFVKRNAFSRGRTRQLGQNLSGDALCADRVVLNITQVVAHPIHQLVRSAAKFINIHFWSLCSRMVHAIFQC